MLTLFLEWLMTSKNWTESAAYTEMIILENAQDMYNVYYITTLSC